MPSENPFLRIKLNLFRCAVGRIHLIACELVCYDILVLVLDLFYTKWRRGLSRKECRKNLNIINFGFVDLLEDDGKPSGRQSSRLLNLIPPSDKHDVLRAM